MSQFLLVAFSGLCARTFLLQKAAFLILLTCDLLFEFGLKWRLSPHAVPKRVFVCRVCVITVVMNKCNKSDGITFLLGAYYF